MCHTPDLTITRTNLKEGLIVLKMKEEMNGPITLIPDDFFNPDPIPQAIYRQALKFEKVN